MVFESEQSDDEHFDTTVDTTSDDSTTTIGKPVTATFISDLVEVPTEHIYCMC